jgi:hypothetical protein
MTSFRKPPKPATADEFVGGGSIQTLPDTVMANSGFPWSDLPSTKRTEIFNLRLTPAETAKLAYIAEKTPYSRQSFILEVLLPAIDEKIMEMTKG